MQTQSSNNNCQPHQPDQDLIRLSIKVDILKGILSKNNSSGERTINPQRAGSSTSPTHSCAFSVNVENMNQKERKIEVNSVDEGSNATQGDELLKPMKI